MISRRSTSIIARFYDLLSVENPESHFAATYNPQRLERFFYDKNYPEWFLRQWSRHGDALQLEPFIKSLQTGTGVIKASVTDDRMDAQQIGQKVLRNLAIDLLDMHIPSQEGPDPDGLRGGIKELLNQLELDGYKYVKGKLYPIDSSVIDEQEEQDYIEVLILNSGLSTPAVIKHHLDLCEQAYADSRWSDAISNARNFLEAIIHQIAEAISLKKSGSSLPANISTRPVEIRKYLEQEGIIDAVEREALGKVYGLISNTGSHPNMAHKDQARLMRHLALTFSQYMLLQWEGYLRNNP